MLISFLGEEVKWIDQMLAWYGFGWPAVWFRIILCFVAIWFDVQQVLDVEKEKEYYKQEMLQIILKKKSERPMERPWNRKVIITENNH